MFKSHALPFPAFAIVILLASASPALAGPPLICHPFQTASAKFLPWGTGNGWNNPLSSYDLGKLNADTLALLDADEGVLTRMENLRRATIYASKDPAIARQLLATLINRAVSPRPSAGAWFDAGYVVEAFKQGIHLRGPNGYYDRQAWAAVDETLKVDGYGFVKKAMAMAGDNAEMEFAASLMTQGSASTAHRAKAAAGAARGSYLEKNLSAF